MEKRILIVEDDPDILFIVEYILRQSGYTTIISPDGDNIINLVEENDPHLVLMDVQLPFHDGRDLSKKLKDQGRDVLIVLMSANRDLSANFTDAKADDFIKKPFDLDHLLQKMEKLLGSDC